MHGDLDYPDISTYWAEGRACSSPASGPAAARQHVPRPPGQVLRVAVLVPRTDIGGGARILFEHANRLAQLGNVVTTYSHGPAPEWFPLQVRHVRVPTGLDLPWAVAPCDVMLCGYWDQLLAAAAAALGPVVHFEQGDFHLFEDLSPSGLAHVRTSMQAADATLAVSGAVKEILDTRFGVEGEVMPNAIDPKVFNEGCGGSAPAPPRRQRSVLCVGWDGNEFKGMDEAREVEAALRTSHPDVEVICVTPRRPLRPFGRVVQAPGQEELAAIYRSADVYMCTSRYESFPLPPLEAMACGTPVVSTRNPGALEYLRDGENAVLVPLRDSTAMHQAVVAVLDDPQLSARLRAKGRITADGYDWKAISSGMGSALRNASTRTTSPLLPRWEDVRPSGTHARPASLDLLEHVLARSQAAEVRVPVSHPAFDGHRVVVWETVLRARAPAKGIVHVNAPHETEVPLTGLPYQRGVDELLSGSAAKAVGLLSTAWRRAANRSVKGAVGRWFALALHERGSTDDALRVLHAGVRAFADNPDYVYLAALVGIGVQDEQQWRLGEPLVHVSGAGMRYRDWFDGVPDLWASAFDGAP